MRLQQLESPTTLHTQRGRAHVAPMQRVRQQARQGRCGVRRFAVSKGSGSSADDAAEAVPVALPLFILGNVLHPAQVRVVICLQAAALLFAALRVVVRPECMTTRIPSSPQQTPTPKPPKPPNPPARRPHRLRAPLPGPVPRPDSIRAPRSRRRLLPVPPALRPHPLARCRTPRPARGRGAGPAESGGVCKGDKGGGAGAGRRTARALRGRAAVPAAGGRQGDRAVPPGGGAVVRFWVARFSTIELVGGSMRNGCKLSRVQRRRQLC